MRKTKSKNSGWKAVFGNPWFLAANLVVLGFVGWSYLREASHGSDVDQQLNDLKRQAAALDAKNRDDQALLNKVGTKSFVDRQARLSLGYQNPGEKEIYLTNGQGQASSSLSSGTPNNAELSNPQKWLRYFFSSK